MNRSWLLRSGWLLRPPAANPIMPTFVSWLSLLRTRSRGRAIKADGNRTAAAVVMDRDVDVLVPRARDPRPPRAQRQRERVRVPRLPDDLRATPRPPSADAGVHAADQRQSGTIYSDVAAGMGVCDGVRDVGRAPPSAASVPGLLQPRFMLPHEAMCLINRSWLVPEPVPPCRLDATLPVPETLTRPRCTARPG